MSLVERLRRKLGLYPQPRPTTEVKWTYFRDDAESRSWVHIHAISTIAGHRSSETADAFGGYLCACQQASWSILDEYGPYGGCPAGWYDAREFLARYGIPKPIDFEAARRHHDFGHRNGLTRCDHNDPLCRKYGCPDDPEWRGDRS